MATTIQKIETPKKYRALDTSGNNNHGQIYSGRGLEFDGIADYLSVSADVATDFPSLTITGSSTISCWINLNSLKDTPVWIASHTDGNQRLGLTLGNEGEIAFVKYDGGGSAYTNKSGGVGTVNINTWYRVVCVLSSGSQKIYINNYELTGTSKADTNNLASHVGNTFKIGFRNDIYFDGMISDLQVWDAAWSAADVTYDYLNPESLALNNSGTSLTNSNLKLWYPMQDGHRGQQSYILDGANTGLKDNMYSTLDFTDGWTGLATGSADSASVFTTTEAGGLYTSGSSTTQVIGTTYKCTLDATTTASSGFEIRNAGDSVIYLTHASTSNYSDSFYFTATHSQFYIKNRSAGTMTVNSISVKPVNDKNHATTVFYGDMSNLLSNAQKTFFDALLSSNDNYFDFSGNSGDGAATLVDSDGFTATNATFARSSAIGRLSNTTTAQGLVTLPFTTVVGRTYDVHFDWAAGNSHVNVSLGASAAYNASNTVTSSSATTYSLEVPFIATATTTYLAIQMADDTSGDNADLDNIYIREVGLASGWTDADQQLHIPQTALQSYNQLAWFDGVADYTSITDHDDFSFGDGSSDSEFSISAWIYMNDATAFAIVSKRSLSNEEWVFKADGSDKLKLQLYDHSTGGYQGRTYDTALTSYEGKWMHVVATYDGNEGDADAGINLYINGEVVDDADSNSGSYTAMEEKDGAVTIGAELRYSNYANGAITEVSIWSTELSQAEVNELYNDGKALDATTHSESSNLVGYWRNNGLATWQDLTSNDRDGTPTSLTETMLIPAGVDATRDNQGFLMNRQKDTSCFNTTVSGGYIEIPVAAVDDDLAFLGVGDGFSIQAWIKMNGDNNTDNAMIVSRNNNTDGYRLEYTTAGKISFGIEENNTIKTAATDSAISIDTWYHVVGTFDGDPGNDGSGEVKLYLNKDTGGSVTNNNTTSNDMDTSISPMRIGKHFWAGAQILDGQIDGVLIYNKVLSLEEVERNYNAGKGSHRN